MDAKERLKKHIKVLNKSYDNIVLIMGEDVKMKKIKDTETKIETKVVALNDDKIGHYADGLKKTASTLDFLFSQIAIKEKELKELEDEGKPESPDKIEEKKDGESSLSKKLK